MMVRQSLNIERVVQQQLGGSWSRIGLHTLVSFKGLDLQVGEGALKEAKHACVRCKGQYLYRFETCLCRCGHLAASVCATCMLARTYCALDIWICVHVLC